MQLNRRFSNIEGKITNVENINKPRFQNMHKISKSGSFEIFISIMYFVNIFLLIFRTYSPGDVPVLFAMETLVITLQIVELGVMYMGSLRLNQPDQQETIDPGREERWWILMDLVVLVGFLGVFGSVILPLAANNRRLVKLRRFQIVRVIRLSRIIKQLRTKSFMKPLYLILHGISASYMTVAFTFALITLVLYWFGVLYVAMLKDSTNKNADRYFGSIDKSLYTMFQILTTESWNEVMRPIYLDHPKLVLVTTAYIAITKYLILSLVTALILEAAMATVSKDEETLAAKHRAERERITKELKFLFQNYLGQEVEVIAKDEYEQMIDVASIKGKLQQVGWYKTDLIDLWELLDIEGSCVLEIDLIVFNIHKLKGKARTKDLLLGLKEASRALRVMDEFVDRLSSSVNAMRRAQDYLLRIQNGAKHIVQNVNKIKIAIVARERVQSRFHDISSSSISHNLICCVDKKRSTRRRIR